MSIDHIKVADVQKLYIMQLQSSIGDLLAAGKARGWFWKPIWEKRVKRAQRLLKQKGPIL